MDSARSENHADLDKIWFASGQRRGAAELDLHRIERSQNQHEVQIESG